MDAAPQSLNHNLVAPNSNQLKLDQVVAVLERYFKFQKKNCTSIPFFYFFFPLTLL